MAVEIKKYSDVFAKRFKDEAYRLRKFLPESTVIEHVGSTAVGIDGKNIIDILIGVDNHRAMMEVRDVLAENGYYVGRDKHEKRIFMASSEEETREGDFHIHICLKNDEEYKDMIVLREYLRKNVDEAEKYQQMKYDLSKKAQFAREEYKRLKAAYVSDLLKRAKINITKI